MFITTDQKLDIEDEIKAKKLAEEFSCPYIQRKSYSLSQLKRVAEDDEVLVATSNGLKFIGSNNLEFFFHPNLAKIRIGSLLKGLKDRLQEVLEVSPSDTILDCTMGLGTDAIVISFLAGELGKVTTIESELVPYVLGRDGLQNYKSEVKELDKAMRRISVVYADHLDYMKSLPDKSVDIVYFDPMFRQSANTVALTPLRAVANDSAIKIEAIYEAKRIARKKVVLKESRNSEEFKRLGFELIKAKVKSKIVYGVIMI